MLCVIVQHSFGDPRWGRHLFFCAVALFFVASGFMTKNMDSTTLFRKCKRLLVPYAVYSLVIGTTIAIFHPNQIGFNETIGERLLRLFAGIAYGRHSMFKNGTGIGLNHYGIAPMWFLPALIVSFALLFLFDNLPKIIRSLFLAFCLAGTILASGAPFYLPWSLDLAPVGFLLILIGRKLRNLEFVFESGFPLADIIGWFAWFLLAEINGFPVRFFQGVFGKHSAASLLLFPALATIMFILVARIARKVHTETSISPLFISIGRESLVFLCLQLFIIDAAKLVLNEFSDNRALVGTICVIAVLSIGTIWSRILYVVGKVFPVVRCLG